MTGEQWIYLNAQISALRGLLQALAALAPDKDGLRKNLDAQKEIIVSAALHQAVPENYLNQLRAEFDRLEASIWGKDR